MAGSEEEIYSIMFSSLKHPVRRKILRMLGNKPMTFMAMVEELGVSTPNLTYHLESLGELISKIDNDQYKLSLFGLATISAMKDIEEVKEIKPKLHLVPLKWKTFSMVLMIVVLLLTSMVAFQYAAMNQLSNDMQSLATENQQLLSYGISANSIPDFLQNITQIDTTKYTISLLSNTLQSRSDFGGVIEEVMQYSLTSIQSNLNIDFRFRNNHFSRYELNMIESSPIFTQIQPNYVLQNAKGTLARYKAYSGDAYLTNMSNLLDTINKIDNIVVTQGNMKLQITVSGSTVVFFWMYTENDIDYQAKGLQMTFQYNVLTTMSDGFFLFTVGNTELSVSREQAITIAKNHVKTLSWTIEGKQVSDFSVLDPPLSVQLVPHIRGNSVALIPYWYIQMSLDKTYGGGINEVTIGIYADTNQVADVQMLSSSINAET
jgi:DNA-binding transcriptional ArsR family regulator